MIIYQYLTGFYLNNQFFLNQQVGNIIAKECSIFIEHFQWILLLNTKPLLAQTMSQGIFIYLFHMTMF